MDILYIIGKAPNEIIESLRNRNITEFTPPQAEAIEKGLLEMKKIVISAPTASGKTLIAELACINMIIRTGKKAVYVAPMRALVMEKYNEFKNSYPYIRSVVSIGDFDSSDPMLKNYDLLFVSTEKFDSLIRHKIEWLDEIGCIVFDEIHMLNDASRGPTLEILITKLKDNINTQIIALSATIGNPEELAKWLNAELVISDYRSVKLNKGIIYKNKFYMLNENNEEEATTLKSTAKLPEHIILEDTLKRRKQAILFYATKRNAESGAQKAIEIVKNYISNDDREKLKKISKKILEASSRPTEQCIKLANIVNDGVAFHHAGLLNEQKILVEDAFKKNLIKAICATTTLGYGINFPAHTVLIRDLSRYNSSYNENLSVNEVLQLFGRAGRPMYDSEGRAVIIANSVERKNELYKRYILAKPESIDSNLGVLPVLRTHILAFISEEFLNDVNSIINFLNNSFYGMRYGNNSRIKSIVSEVCKELINFNFVDIDNYEKLKATSIGKRVSELYIDPVSAKWIIDSLNIIDKNTTIDEILYLITNTLEMRPYVREVPEVESAYNLYQKFNSRIYEKYERIDYGYYDPLRVISTALMLKDWVEEEREDEIIAKYHTTPGELHTKIMNADWIIYSTIELAKLIKKNIHELINARIRLRYGVKEELLDLIRLEQIGRVRARLLYDNKIKKVSDIKNNKQLVYKLLGKEVSEKIFVQIP
ncbi:MAG: DEAD/DEAH box helicase [Candidatus Marsarchaeota archaeon]|nr:DEAD/DEAH box helicase [Candidatus Marsarchaeota archaeon]